MQRVSGYVLGFLVSTSVTAIAGFDYSQCTDLDEQRAHVERKALALKVYSRQLEGVIGQAVGMSGKLPSHMEPLLHLKERLNKKLDVKQKLLQTLSEKGERTATTPTVSSKISTVDGLKEEGQFWIISAQTLNTAGFKNSDDKLFGSWDLFRGYMDAHPSLKGSILPQNPATMDPTSYVKLVSNRLLTYENVLVYVQEKAIKTTLKAIKLPLDQDAIVVSPTTLASFTADIIDENEIILRDIILCNKDIADKEKYKTLASEMAKRGVKNLTPQELELAVKLHLPIIPITFEGNEINEDDLKRKITQISESTINDLDISGLYFFDASTLDRVGHIKMLNLSENQLTSVPECLGQLVNLEHLNLSNNKLTFLPENLGQMRNLKTLNLSHNHLTALPLSMGNMKNLTSLHLDFNRFTIFPESIGNIITLTNLHFYGNKLTSVPESIWKLKNLITLNLGLNKLTSISPSITLLKNLNALYLFANQLSSIPENIGELENLTEVILYSNQLTSLPESIGKLTKVHTLHFSDNPIASLPVSCEQLINLKELVLYDTKLTQLPASLKKPTLKSTGLGQVCIKTPYVYSW